MRKQSLEKIAERKTRKSLQPVCNTKQNERNNYKAAATLIVCPEDKVNEK